MIEQLVAILKKEGYFNIEHIETMENEITFEAYSDAEVEIKVKIEGDVANIYDRYLAEKHSVHQGIYQLSTGKEIK